MSEIRDYAGGYRTGDTVFWAGDELEVSAGMDDWTTVVCENEERVPLGEGEGEGAFVPEATDLTPVRRKHWRAGDRVLASKGGTHTLIQRSDRNPRWITDIGIAADEWLAEQPPVLDSETPSTRTPRRITESIPACASCGKPADEGCDVNGQPRCGPCSNRMLGKLELPLGLCGRCGQGLAMSMVAEEEPALVCPVHATGIDEPHTGRAWEHAAEPGDRARDEMLRAVFGGGR